MRHFPIRELGYAIGFVVLLAALYAGSYYAMVEPKMVVDESSGSTRWDYISFRTKASYRFGGHASEALFAPVEEIDRKLFPDRWPSMK